MQISIHAPAWGATECHPHVGHNRHISIHAPAWGATGFIYPVPAHRIISIHAPAWGATYFLSGLIINIVISIHAPAWGATGDEEKMTDPIMISIHAPAWGATGFIVPPPFERQYFNPRTRVGCDVDDKNIYQLLPLFQSTHPRGVRPRFSFRNRGPRTFQSTHPRGVRLLNSIGLYLGFKISIHAPAWGATRARSLPHTRRAYFNPRTRVGCDPAYSSNPVYATGHFNPRTRVGCDAKRRAYRARAKNFNPRTRVGCDQVSALLR